MGIKYLYVILFTTLWWRKAQTQFQLTKVVGGSPAQIEQFPILAQLLFDVYDNQQFDQHCAGIILTSRHVLSAAHCFQFYSSPERNHSVPKFWRIRVGSSFRTRGGVLHKLKSIISHENFDKRYYTNDIAVVVVARPFKFSNNIKQGTIMKHRKDLKPDSVCTLVGWGALMSDGPQPDQLQITTMYTIDQAECSRRFSTINAVIADSMMCAGRLNLGGADGCFGDSGGPLIYKGVVVGLVSFGYGCGHPYYPGVYTKVSHYTDWIVKTVSDT